ncbi:NAD(P)H-quinone oxidoreductase subunit N [Gloeobacter violaceus]|uniref:NAD(P)H-quinone oxidoreductase subunit N n=1 Tax=Gloeobacter violaceus (strain ATCC 29082 / PCC 7421) TaxID=251221 RepID=NDHN_GLOVI|nr:NAD(P)H-quinone oxidoreductase subunit N [Gloeobacter violaceus]Q7NEV8.1 RecName: Full=NAD(P)H-quinone oxidoreductase subunit N; AltName: Full=NAD(P)H dehydrogenase I subunit N; Short=NDH-1 subunit N; Short=NDH-N [Gloeobacter violaceus PCC 7421]BAC91711.1 gll3770 [Gloeobacter violaceus PCC 7421]
MPLLNLVLDNGSRFVADVEKHSSIALWAPPEGGIEGNYQRRLRGIGYRTQIITAKGLGDISRFLLESHGVRPAHLGKKDKRVFTLPPELAIYMDTLPASAKGFVLWIIEGKVLSLFELESLVGLPAAVPKLKVIVEVGSDYNIRWMPLEQAVSKMAEGR